MKVNPTQGKRALAVAVMALGLVASSATAAGPDPSFGTDGRADLSALRFFAKEGTLGMVADQDSIFITSPRGSISRLDADGAADMAFGRGGYQAVAPYVPAIRGGLFAPAMAIQKDGKVLVAGSYGSRPLLSRLTADGNLDPSFSQDGAVLCRKLLWCSNGQLTDVEVDARGRIVVSGFLRVRHNGKPSAWGFIRRYRPNGKPDRSFAKKGRALFKGSNSAGVYFGAVEFARKGRIVVLRWNSKGTSAIALRPSGRLDRRFAKRSRSLRLPYANDLDSVPGGRIMAFGVSSGNSTSEVAGGCARLYAFNWAGVRSGGFSRDGKRRICPSRFGATFPPLELSSKGIYDAAFAVQPNAKPVISLGLLGKPISGGVYVLRLDADGAIDRTFADHGLFRTGLPQGGIPVAALDSGVLVSAGTDELPGLPSSYIYRFRP